MFFRAGQGQPGDSDAVDARSGTIHWQERGIEEATFVSANQKLMALDRDGDLMIAQPVSPQVSVAAKAPLLATLSWTPPCSSGHSLYIRDRRT